MNIPTINFCFEIDLSKLFIMRFILAKGRLIHYYLLSSNVQAKNPS